MSNNIPNRSPAPKHVRGIFKAIEGVSIEEALAGLLYVYSKCIRVGVKCNPEDKDEIIDTVKKSFNDAVIYMERD